jgi:hypothetical protein
MNKLEHQLCIRNVLALIRLYAEPAVIGTYGDEIGGGRFDFELKVEGELM